MTASADLLACLDRITHETTTALDVLESLPPSSDRREAKRRVLVIRDEAQTLFEWISAARLEEPRN